MASVIWGQRDNEQVMSRRMKLIVELVFENGVVNDNEQVMSRRVKSITNLGFKKHTVIRLGFLDSSSLPWIRNYYHRPQTSFYYDSLVLKACSAFGLQDIQNIYEFPIFFAGSSMPPPENP